MWVEAILSKDNLALIVADFCPLTIALGQGVDDDHYLKLVNPKDVRLVEARGLRLTCEAEICWPVLGVDVPIHVESLTIMLSPTLATAFEEDVLTFKPELEDVELSWVPGVFDGAMTEKINHELSKRHVELSWHFFKTLNHVFALPGLLRPATALALRVAWGKVRVTQEAMVMAVSFHTRVLRNDRGELLLGRESALLPAGAIDTPVRSSPRAPGVTVPISIVVAAAAAFVGLFAFVALGPSIRLWRYVERA